MPNIRKHGNKFQVRYYSDGLPQIESFDSLESAQIRVKEIDLLKAKGLTVDSRPNTVKFGELAKAVVDFYEVNEYRSRDDIECRYRIHLIPFFGKRKAASITPGLINAYILKRKESAPNSTINRELEAMKRAFNLGHQHGLVLNVPHIPRLREDNVRTGFFTREEVDKLCAHLPAPLNSFVLFAFLTGWRYSEIQGLQWKDVDFKSGLITLDPGKTKNREGRTFPMSGEITNLLHSLKVSAVADRAGTAPVGMKHPVMPTLAPSVFVLHGRPIGAFRKTWARACYKAGLPCVVSITGNRKHIKALRLFHDLRRSAVRELVRTQGLSEREAMILTGHKTRSVFDRYSVVSMTDMETIRAKLNMAKSMAKPTTKTRGRQ